MTEQNFIYRTNPLFLRCGFYGMGKHDIPIIPKPTFSKGEIENFKVIGFDMIKSDNGKHSDRAVHFFLYDYKFKRIWEKPEQDIELIKKYKAMMTPDFSMYIEMPKIMKMYNTFRNRWCGAYYSSKGIRVIPTINWGLEDTFDFCFDGIEKGSAVAVSTYMAYPHDINPGQKDFFMNGYKEMMRIIEPEIIFCYNTPFEEMQGNIFHIDYELNSWRYM